MPGGGGIGGYMEPDTTTPEEDNLLGPRESSGAQRSAEVLLGGGATGSLSEMALRRIDRAIQDTLTDPFDPLRGNNGRVLTAEEANRLYGIEGGRLQFTHPIDEAEAQWRQANKRDELMRESILERSPLGGPATFGLSLAGGFIDPVSLGVAFVPVVGEARLMEMMGLAGTTASRAAGATGIGARGLQASRSLSFAEGAARGAYANAYGGIYTQGLEWSLAASEGRDYTPQEAGAGMLNAIVFGAGIGGALHAGGWRSPREPWTESSLDRLMRNVVRAESHGDNSAVNKKSGALGAGQVMSGTGQDMARKLGIPWDPDLMHADTPEGLRYNLQISREYMKTQLIAWGGDEVLALAAYNAGPGRVADWIKLNGDPRTGEISHEEWVNAIPFPETRDYVRKTHPAFNGDEPGTPPGGVPRGAPNMRADQEEGFDPVPTSSKQMDANSVRKVAAVAIDQMGHDRDVDVIPVIEQETLHGSEPRPDLDDIDTPEDGFPSRRYEADKAITTEGREFPVEYAIVEADHLITSDNDEMQSNPNYPDALQPRDRGRKGSQARLLKLEKKFHPGLVMRSPDAAAGAPVVARDGVVESGNGRAILLRRNARRNTALWQRYKEELEKHGFDTTGFDKPILVRIRRSVLQGAERIALTREMNKNPLENLSVTEQAMVDAGTLSDEDMGLFKGGEIGSVANAAFQRRFIDKVASGAENEFTDPETQGLSKDGEQRIRAALVAKAYGSSRLVYVVFETLHGNLATIGKAMASAAPEWAAMRAKAARGESAAWADQTENLLEAVNLIRHVRDNRNLDLGEEVAKRKETDIFTGQSGMSVETEAWVRAFFTDEGLTKAAGEKRATAALRDYTRQAMDSTPGPDLLGAENAQSANATLQGVVQRLKGIVEDDEPLKLPLGGDEARSPASPGPADAGPDLPPPGQGPGDEGGTGLRPEGGGGTGGEGGGDGRGPGGTVGPAPFEGAKPRPPEPGAPNRLGDLGDHADRLYRQTDVERFMESFLPGSGISQELGDVHLADTPDLALGQGDNTGVTVEFDAAGLKGKRNVSKPGLEFVSAQGGGSEFVGRYNGQDAYQNAVRAFRIAHDAKARPAVRERVQRTLDKLVKEGWQKIEGDGFTEYRRPDLAGEARPAEAKPGAGPEAGGPDPVAQAKKELEDAEKALEDARKAEEARAADEARIADEAKRRAEAGPAGPEDPLKAEKDAVAKAEADLAEFEAKIRTVEGGRIEPPGMWKARETLRAAQVALEERRAALIEAPSASPEFEAAVRAGPQSALEWLAANAQDPLHRAVAAKLLKEGGVGDVVLEVVDRAAVVSRADYPSDAAFNRARIAQRKADTRLTRGKARAMLEPSTQPGEPARITVGKMPPGHGLNGLRESTVTHELVHAWVAARYRMLRDYNRLSAQLGRAPQTGDVAIDAFLDLHQQLKTALGKSRHKATRGETWAKEMIRSPDEALTWSLTSRDAQAWLKTHDIQGNPLKEKGRSFWDHIVDLFAKALGIAEHDRSAFGAFLEASGRLFEEGKADPASGEVAQAMSARHRAMGGKSKQMPEALGEAADTPPGNVALPADLDLSDPSLAQLRQGIERGDFHVRVEQEGGRRIIHIEPVTPPGWERTAKGHLYDPAMASETEFGRVALKDREAQTFPGEKEEGYVWRGMSGEEYAEAVQRGHFASRGDYNLSPEDGGLSYFTTYPPSAASYANGFAPWEWAGTARHPPVVVKVKADPSERVNVSGIGPEEFPLRGEVPTDRVAEVWIGRPISADPGRIELTEQGGRGSQMAPATQFKWEKAPTLEALAEAADDPLAAHVARVEEARAKLAEATRAAAVAARDERMAAKEAELQATVKWGMDTPEMKQLASDNESMRAMVDADLEAKRITDTVHGAATAETGRTMDGLAEAVRVAWTCLAEEWT